MDLKALRYFAAAVDTGSITAAAEACFIAQPSITAAIRKLEQEFDAQLLERSKRGVVTTAQGKMLYQMAQNLLSHAASVKSRMTEAQSAEAVHISVAPSISYEYLNQVLMLIQKHRTGDTTFIRRGTFQGEPDLLLTASNNVPPGYEFFPLWRDQYCVLLPLTHKLTYQSHLTLSDFYGIDLVEREFCELRQEWDRLIEQFEHAPNIVATVDNEEWALRLVASGVGITFAPVNSIYQTGALNTALASSTSHPVKNSAAPRFCARPLSDIAGVADRHRNAGVALRSSWHARASFEALFATDPHRFAKQLRTAQVTKAK
ncbi:LysR family transcriptional regulator [Allohahella marinimesophila]|uniref:HTH lysR-type domain-containing protein n=1 Tax=Allohahella marinimesophila TaxID=1054972 RepID=A0ABP7NGL4_9GAMM